MSILAAKHSSTPARDAADTIRSKVVQFRSAALPKAASAAESAGEAVSKLALSASKNVAGALRPKRASGIDRLAAILPAAPLARSAARFAIRNPAVLALAGVGIAAIGYMAWRRQQADLLSEVEDEAEEGEAEAIYSVT